MRGKFYSEKSFELIIEKNRLYLYKISERCIFAT